MIGINDIIPIFDIGTRVIEKGSNNPKGLYINGRYNDKYETFYVVDPDNRHLKNSDIDFEVTFRKLGYEAAIVNSENKILLTSDLNNVDGKAEILYQIKPESEPLEFGNATTTPTSTNPTELCNKVKWLELACELHMIQSKKDNEWMELACELHMIERAYKDKVVDQIKVENTELGLELTDTKKQIEKLNSDKERYKKMIDLLIEKPDKIR